MIKNGVTADFAERVFEQIRGFGEYGFPESHAASFALIARRHGVELRPIDVRRSDWDCTLEPRTITGGGGGPDPRDRWAIRMGLRWIKGFHHADGKRLLAARSANGSSRQLCRHQQAPQAGLAAARRGRRAQGLCSRPAPARRPEQHPPRRRLGCARLLRPRRRSPALARRRQRPTARVCPPRSGRGLPEHSASTSRTNKCNIRFGILVIL
jgi:hypothetical protein